MKHAYTWWQNVINMLQNKSEQGLQQALWSGLLCILLVDCWNNCKPVAKTKALSYLSLISNTSRKHISGQIPWRQQTHWHQQLVIWVIQRWCLWVQLITAQTLSPWMREDARQTDPFFGLLPIYLCLYRNCMICMLSTNINNHSKALKPTRRHE